MSDEARGAERHIAEAVAWGVAALIIGAPLLLGGTRPDTQLLLCGVSLVLLGAHAIARRRKGLRMPWPLWAPVLLVVLAAVQLVPLSVDTLEALSPAAAELRRLSLADLGAYAERRHPLSLDAPATWIALFHQLAFAAVAVTAANLGRHRGRLLGALAISGAVLTLIGLAQHLMGLDRIYGLYAIQGTQSLRGFFSTFVNGNTLAGSLVVSTLVAMGLVVRAHDDRTQSVWLACAALSGLGTLLSGSRGGQLALLAGLGVFALLAHARGETHTVEGARKRARGTARLALVTALCGVLLAVYLQQDWQALLTAPNDREKTAFWDAAWRYAGAFPAFGSGRGTFTFVYPFFQDLTVSGTVSHPETIGLQLATEWGIPGAAVALLGGLGGWWYGLRALGRETRPAHWGLLAGLAAVGLQQLVDFGFEAAGLSLPVAAALGLAMSTRRDDAQASEARRPWRAWVAGAAVAAGLAFLAVKGPAALAEQADGAIAGVADAPPNLIEIERRATEAVYRHPADPIVPLNAANRLAQLPDVPVPRVLRWLNRSIALQPSAGRPHLLAGRVMDGAGLGDQAAVEFRLAMDRMPWARLGLVREVAERFVEPGRLVQAIPPTPRNHRVLGNVLLEHHGLGRAREVMRLVLLEHPDDPEAHRALARACARLRDVPCIREEAAWLIAHGAPATGRALEAHLAFRDGELKRARAALEAGERDGGLDDGAFLRSGARLYLQLGDLEAARRLADRLWSTAGSDDQTAAAALSLRAEVSAASGDHAGALRAWRDAYARSPGPRYALGATEAARALGRLVEAHALLDDARRRWPKAAVLRRANIDVEAPP